MSLSYRCPVDTHRPRQLSFPMGRAHQLDPGASLISLFYFVHIIYVLHRAGQKTCLHATVRLPYIHVLIFLATK